MVCGWTYLVFQSPSTLKAIHMYWIVCSWESISYITTVVISCFLCPPIIRRVFEDDIILRARHLKPPPILIYETENQSFNRQFCICCIGLAYQLRVQFPLICIRDSCNNYIILWDLAAHIYLADRSLIPGRGIGRLLVLCSITELFCHEWTRRLIK